MGNKNIPDLSLVTLRIILITAGFLIAFIVVVLSLAKTNTSKGRGGAVVIIGPVPIIFGSDQQSAKILLILSIVLVAALLLLFLLQAYL